MLQTQHIIHGSFWGNAIKMNNRLNMHIAQNCLEGAMNTHGERMVAFFILMNMHISNHIFSVVSQTIKLLIFMAPIQKSKQIIDVAGKCSFSNDTIMYVCKAVSSSCEHSDGINGSNGRVIVVVLVIVAVFMWQ